MCHTGSSPRRTNSALVLSHTSCRFKAQELIITSTKIKNIMKSQFHIIFIFMPFFLFNQKKPTHRTSFYWCLIPGASFLVTPWGKKYSSALVYDILKKFEPQLKVRPDAVLPHLQSFRKLSGGRKSSSVSVIIRINSIPVALILTFVKRDQSLKSTPTWLKSSFQLTLVMSL